jgi:hypothetical protein
VVNNQPNVSEFRIQRIGRQDGVIQKEVSVKPGPTKMSAYGCNWSDDVGCTKNFAYRVFVVVAGVSTEAQVAHAVNEKLEGN